MRSQIRPPAFFRQFSAASIVMIVFGCFLIACGALSGPNAAALCPGILYCGSSLVPQSVTGGTCCAVLDFSTNRALPNASVGYLCAFGANRQPAGCAATLDQARTICPTAPSIVRCASE